MKTKIVMTFVLCAALTGLATAAGSPPQFKDYPAQPVQVQRNHPLVMDDFGKAYRTRLSDAIKSEKPSFAGKYLVVRWGCGSSGCNTGAVVDVTTGKATPFPVSMSSVFPLKPEFEGKDEQELHYRLDSRLMVFAGNLETDHGEGTDTVEFYEFTGDGFRFIKSLPYGRKASE
ncbi:MAG: hypothetical protein Q4G70_13010 [Pseudomonadota bacterium]|nr:hypothetical protein [Pseudomonadota bacterium]